MTQQLSISQALNSPNSKSKFQELLGKRATQFITSVLSAVNNNTLLANATWESIYQSAITAATLDLPINPNLGFAYIVPYKSKKKIDNKWTEIGEGQFQLGYKGFIQLAQRSGKFKTINVSDVKDGEINNFDRLTGEITFDWKVEGREKLETIGYVAYFELLNGFTKLLYMTKAELEGHGSKFSKSYNSSKLNYKTQKEEYTGLWRTNFESMAQKTVLKLLLSKYAPLSTQMELALTSDQAVMSEDGASYVDNDKSNTVDIVIKSELQKFIESEVETLEALQSVENQINTEEEQLAYDTKFAEFNKPKTSDGALIEDEKQTTNV